MCQIWCFYHKMHDSLIFGHLAAGLRALFSLLSNSDVSYMVIPFDIFESAQAADVKGIKSIAITDGQVPW